MDEFKRSSEKLVGILMLFCLVCVVLIFDSDRVLGLDVAEVEKNANELATAKNKTVATETQKAGGYIYVGSDSSELGSFTSSTGLLVDWAIFKPSPWFKFEGEKGSVSVNVNTGEVVIDMDGVKNEAEAGKVAAVIFWEAFGQELKRLCSETEKEN